MRIIAAFASLYFVLWSSAQAQTVTDVELKAAYCFGAATAQYRAVAESLRNVQDPRLKGLHEYTAKQINERRLRFRDYLMAKGFAAERDAGPLEGPIAHGRQDVATCGTENNEPFYRRCDEQCHSRFADDLKYLDCNASCPTPNSCTRVKKCLENFLPF